MLGHLLDVVDAESGIDQVLHGSVDGAHVHVGCDERLDERAAAGMLALGP